MNDDEVICVECGTCFSVDDADDISYSTGSIKCPECGRYNYQEQVAEYDFAMDEFDMDESLVDTDEIYTENYFSKDLEYDGENKYESHKYKKIGVAKSKNTIPIPPVYEYRQKINQYRNKEDNIDPKLKKDIDDFFETLDISEAEQ